MDAAARAELPPSADQFVAAAASGPWPAFRSNGVVDAAAETFLRGLYEDASDDELGDLSVADFAALAHDFWIWRSERSCDAERCIRIRRGIGVAGNALDRDVLEIAGPDMPFLVDSVMGELADQGIAPLAMFHPIAPSATGLGRDSLIQIHLPRLSAQRAKALEEGVRASLEDVHVSVRDYQPMRQRMLACADELEQATTNAPAEDVAEAVALLRWFADNKFTFLGARDYQYKRNADGSFKADEPDILEHTCLGVLSDPERYVLRTSAEPMVLTPELKRLIAEPEPLIVAKSTLRARVHRRATSDYVGVRRYSATGEVVGEVRFVGLFTSESFTEPTRNIPMLRRKAQWVMDQTGFTPGGHNAKTLRKIIEYYPREELWQMSREELLRISRGVLHLLDRPRARVFNRRDRFNRFVTALAYIPKDSFNTELRERAGEVIAAAYGGKVESFTPQLGEGQLARVLFVIGDIEKGRPDPNQAELDGEIAAMAYTWHDRFLAELMRSPLLAASQRDDVINRFEEAFTAAYHERYSVEEALVDVAEILSASDDEIIRARAYRLPGEADNIMRCKFYARGDVLALSATVPILENMGLFVDSEQNFELQLAAGPLTPAQRIFVHDIETRSADGKPIDLAKAAEPFEEAFAAVWTNKAESDGFNKLIIALPCSWREAALIRALARYRQQTGLDPSQAVQEAALAEHPKIAELMLTLFRARFCPTAPISMETRLARSSKFEGLIEAALNDVDSLDQDRALRRMAQLITAIRRTNYYQPGADGQIKPYMSFKIDSHAVSELPAPKPYREIWVASPQVEGVHLRFGPVARGGLRWSDRRDDFRTEVLDLVKAQQVKNAIIVPVGAKGGFYPKRLPPRGAPNFQEAGIDAYKTFLRGLLDITDNIVADAIVAPKEVVRWDDDDAYLVVAADKGTATFSDIANGISAEYGHWLGDAFASGGSVGYDHKAMGITAKGAWEAVKRHFREIGKDIQTTPFTVIGVGDMSGDVFGNGMLLSHKIRLLAAFDHRDIFIDPDPKDEEASFVERQRLFDKPRSSWQDYDKRLISKGGGVFSRALKSIPISKEIAALTGLKDQATPAELITALLKAQCELMWFGGIGAYIKARAETNADVGDKANDVLRVDAEDLKCQVIGEGANLGVTQKGRIAFARTGGHINTDAIDNSAGVDTSDHEVNIKILLGDAIRAGALKADKRDKLLESMTGEVGALVLRNNYDQTLALTLAQTSAVADLDSHERFIQRLEAAGKLSRRVEGLPLTGEFATLRLAKLGLTRPELAKLVAYAKIDLFDSIVASAAPDDHAFYEPLKCYFPREVWMFEAQMHSHRLRREIIATQLANDVVNVGGPTFVDRLRETSRAEPVVIACAFEAARRIFKLNALSDSINALDNKAPAAAQIALHQALASALRQIAAYLARHAGFDREAPASIDQVVRLYREPVDEQRAHLWDELGEAERARVEKKQTVFAELGAPDKLARDVAELSALTTALDVSDLARRTRWPVHAAALLHSFVGDAFGLETLREATGGLTLDQHWDRLVMRRAAEDFAETQLKLAEAAATAIGAPAKNAEGAWMQTAVNDWVQSLGVPAQRVRSAYDELEAQGPWTFAKLMLVAAELNALASAVR